MKTIARIISMAALVGTIAPPVLFFLGYMGLETTMLGMLVATVVWFAATPIWMDR